MAASESVLDRLLAAGGQGTEANLRRWYQLAGIADDQPIEIQALSIPTGRDRLEHRAAFALTFADAVRLLQEAEKMKAEGVYLLAHRLRADVEKRRVANEFVRMVQGKSTTDNDMAARCGLYVDCDVDRPRGTSSTDEQLAASVEVAEAVARRFEAILGGRRSIALGLSGNGAAVLLALDALPADAATTSTVSGILCALSFLHRTERIKIDTSVSDLKRLLPAWGTTKRKGAPAIATHPHRKTGLLVPPDLQRLGAADLVRIADALRADLTPEQQAAMDKAMGRQPATATGGKVGTGKAPRADGERDIFAEANEIEIQKVCEWLGLYEDGQIKCPGCSLSGDSSVAQVGNGIKCSHDRCSAKGRKGFRSVVDTVVEVKGCTPFQAVKQLFECFGIQMPEREKQANTASQPGAPPSAPAHEWADYDDSEAARSGKPPPAPFATPIRVFLGDDEDDVDAPEPCVIDRILPAGVPALLVGEAKAVKTYVAADMGVCVAAGIPWAGFATKQGRVIMYLEEDTKAQVRRRLWWLGRGHDLDPRELPISVTAMAGVRLDDPAHVERLIAESKGAALIVIDALSRVHGSDENDRTAMRTVTLAWSRIAAETGATVLVIHHYRKSGKGDDKIRPGQRARGTSDLHALVRAVIGVEKVASTKEYSQIHLTPESNYGDPVEPFALRFTIGQRPDGKRAAKFQTVLMLSEDATLAFEAIRSWATSIAELREAFGGRNARWSAAVAELVKHGLLKATRKGQPLQAVEAG